MSEQKPKEELKTQADATEIKTVLGQAVAIIDALHNAINRAEVREKKAAESKALYEDKLASLSERYAEVEEKEKSLAKRETIVIAQEKFQAVKTEFENYRTNEMKNIDAAKKEIAKAEKEAKDLIFQYNQKLEKIKGREAKLQNVNL